MEPKKVGRTLGIGVRVASNMLRQRVEQAAAPRPAPKPASSEAENGRPSAAPTSPFRRNTGSQGAAIRRGAKAFGQAFLGPFTHAGSVLWLEITGLFFALFAVYFGQGVYRVRTAWRQGPEHTHLLLYAALAIAFTWFSASSFTRAFRKSRRGPEWRK
jgi:hypothetical protein